MSTVLKGGAVVVALAAGFSVFGQEPNGNPFQNNTGQAAVTAQAEQGSALDNLKLNYRKDVQAAVKPIQDGYVAALQTLVKTLTQNRALDQAVAVDQELKKTQGELTPYFTSDVKDAPGPASGMRSPLEMLEADHRGKLLGAIKPLQDRYARMLNSLLDAATRSGDLQSALAVRDELAKATGAQAAANGAGADAGPGNGWYYMQAQISGLYLHVLNGSHNAGARVDQNKKMGGQVWKFIPDGKGNYFIQSQASELFLDAKFNGDSEDQVNQTPEMVWQLIPDGKGNYFIQSVATGNYLNTSWGNKDVGGKIDQGGKDDRQTWKLVPADNEL